MPPKQNAPCQGQKNLEDRTYETFKEAFDAVKADARITASAEPKHRREHKRDDVGQKKSFTCREWFFVEGDKNLVIVEHPPHRFTKPQVEWSKGPHLHGYMPVVPSGPSNNSDSYAHNQVQHPDCRAHYFFRQFWKESAPKADKVRAVDGWGWEDWEKKFVGSQASHDMYNQLLLFANKEEDTQRGKKRVHVAVTDLTEEETDGEDFEVEEFAEERVVEAAITDDNVVEIVQSLSEVGHAVKTGKSEAPKTPMTEPSAAPSAEVAKAPLPCSAPATQSGSTSGDASKQIAPVAQSGSKSGDASKKSKKGWKIRWTTTMTQAEFEQALPSLSQKLADASSKLTAEDVQKKKLSPKVVEKLKSKPKLRLVSFSSRSPAVDDSGSAPGGLGGDADTPEEGKAPAEARAIEETCSSALEEVAAKVSGLCAAKAEWARGISLSEPCDLSKELSELMAGTRMADVESPDVEDPRELLRKCSGGRALQGCIPTKEHWQLLPPQHLMAVPQKVEMKVLSWSTDIETRSETMEECSMMRTMAKSFGVTRARNLETSSNVSVAGYSKQSESKESSAEKANRDESNASKSSSRSHTSHHLRVKAIGRFLLDLPEKADLAFSVKAMQRLRSIYKAWLPHSDSDVVMDLLAEQERSRMLRAFFEDFGSHLNCGPISIGGLFMIEGKITSKEELSAESSSKLFAQTVRRESSESQKSGFDGEAAKKGLMPEAGGAEAAGGQAGMVAQGVGKLLQTVHVSTSNSSAASDAKEQARQEERETVEQQRNAAVEIKRSTYGGLPTDDLVQWSESVMRESEKGARLEVIDFRPDLVGVWEIVQNSYWDFGTLKAHVVQAKELANFVTTLQLVFEDSYFRYFTFLAMSFGVERAVLKDREKMLQTMHLPNKPHWVLMIPKADKRGIPSDDVRSILPATCTAWVNSDYKSIQEFAQYLMLEFKAMFGQASSCPICNRQCLPCEMPSHLRHCSANESLPGIFSQKEKELFLSYELRMHYSGMGTGRLGFCLMMKICCFLCGEKISACKLFDHLRDCSKAMQGPTSWKVKGEGSKGVYCDPVGVLPLTTYKPKIPVNLQVIPGSDAENFMTISGLIVQKFIPFARKLPPHVEAMLKEGYTLRRKNGVLDKEEAREKGEMEATDAIKLESMRSHWEKEDIPEQLQRFGVHFNQKMKEAGFFDKDNLDGDALSTHEHQPADPVMRTYFMDKSQQLRHAALSNYCSGQIRTIVQKFVKKLKLPLSKEDIEEQKKACREEIQNQLERKAWKILKLDWLCHCKDAKVVKCCEVTAAQVIQKVDNCVEWLWEGIEKMIPDYSLETWQAEWQDGVWFLGCLWQPQKDKPETKEWSKRDNIDEWRFCNAEPLSKRHDDVLNFDFELFFDEQSLTPAQRLCRSIYTWYTQLQQGPEANAKPVHEALDQLQAGPKLEGSS